MNESGRESQKIYENRPGSMQDGTGSPKKTSGKYKCMLKNKKFKQKQQQAQQIYCPILIR